MRTDQMIGVLTGALVIVAGIMNLRTRTRNSMLFLMVSLMLMLAWLIVIKNHVF